MKVIAISGHAQNGKDTVAGIMAWKLRKDGYNVLIAHYAGLLKYICKTFFDWDGNKDEEGRHILQYVGTDVIRNEAPDYWVDFISSILKFFGSNWDWVIIPDTRFPNEIDKLKENGFDTTHIRVKRPNFTSPLTEEQQKHPSETALDDIEPDYVIVNNGTLANLDEAITNWIKENVNEHEA